MFRIFFTGSVIGRILPLLLIIWPTLIIWNGLAANAQAETSQAGKRTFVISAIVNEQTHAVAKQVLKRAYHRLGHSVIFDDLPGLRALEWANSGQTDGDVARIMGTETKYPNLRRVNVPVIYFKGVAFSKNPDLKIEDWVDLSGLRVGVVRGIRYSTIGTKGMSPVLANDMKHLFTILDMGRIDVAVAVFDAGKVEIARHFKGSGIRPVGEPLFQAPLFHYVNVKMENMIQPLEQTLKAMTDSGEINKIWEQSLQNLLNN